jgi:transposase
MTQDLKQIYKARKLDAVRWRDAGLTYREIAERLGVCKERARDIVERGFRERTGWKRNLQKANLEFSTHLKEIWPQRNARRKRLQQNVTAPSGRGKVAEWQKMI